MPTKQNEIQRLMRHYREVTGKPEIDMHAFAKWAIAQGWPMPMPLSPEERLAREFSKAARAETRRDNVTGKPYRANHAAPSPSGQGMLWYDIDENPPRDAMRRSFTLRREQMVGDGLQLSFDADHWNRLNPNQQPISLEFDLSPDIEWAKNAPDEDEKAS